MAQEILYWIVFLGLVTIISVWIGCEMLDHQAPEPKLGPRSEAELWESDPHNPAN